MELDYTQVEGLNSMLVDVRYYFVSPGSLKLQLDLYQQFGFEPQKRHLGDPFAFLITETGELNSYVHIWAYEDAADRMRRRQSLQKDPEWLAYAEKSAVAGHITRKKNQLMTPAPFVALRGLDAKKLTSR